MTREGIALRIVTYLDPVGGETYEFLTHEPDLPPGVIVELYRHRWEGEKVFDEIKTVPPLRTSSVHAGLRRPQGHPAQREVHPLAPPIPVRPVHGSHRRAPPPVLIRLPVTSLHAHRSVQACRRNTLNHQLDSQAVSAE